MGCGGSYRSKVEGAKVEVGPPLDLTSQVGWGKGPWPATRS